MIRVGRRLTIVRAVRGGERNPAQCLNRKGHDRDDSSSKIRISEALHICYSFGFAFNFLERGEDLGKLLFAFVSAMAETIERLQSICLAVLACEPPGRLRHEPNK